MREAKATLPAMQPKTKGTIRRTMAAVAGAAMTAGVFGGLALPAGGSSGSASGAVTSSTSPTSYVAPDGRSFYQLVAMHVLPDPSQTPGVPNADVTPDTITSTVCVKGWTAKVRPPDSYTDGLKGKETPPQHTASEYELDHLVSIEDGGDPRNPSNLWMQTYNDTYGARTKDVLETRLKTLVCANKITLDQARAALAPNWLVGFEKYVGPLPTGD